MRGWLLCTRADGTLFSLPTEAGLTTLWRTRPDLYRTEGVATTLARSGLKIPHGWRPLWRTEEGRTGDRVCYFSLRNFFDAFGWQWLPYEQVAMFFKPSEATVIRCVRNERNP